MKRLLLIDPDTVRAKKLAAQLESSSLFVRVTPCGISALTMLERERPDLILTRGELSDMTGSELCQIVRRDLDLVELRVGLLRDPGGAAPVEATFDLALDADDAGAVRNSVHHLLELPTKATVEIQPKAQIKPEKSPEEESLTGHLGLASLSDFIESFSATRRSGKLTLDSKDGQGIVIFDRGQITHTAFGALTGRRALAALSYDVSRAPNAAFFFQSLNHRQLAAFPRSIDMLIPQLLKTIAEDLEQYRTQDIKVPLESQRSES